MNEKLKAQLQVQITRNVQKRAKLFEKADKIKAKISRLEVQRDRIYEKENRLAKLTHSLVDVYNSNNTIKEFNELRKKQLEKVNCELQQ